MLGLKRSLARVLTAASFGLGAAMLGGGAIAAPPNLAGGGLAVHGYDVVAYFTLHRAVKGVAAYQAIYRGATYRFASAIDRIAFVARPAHYAPQYGGYCAWSMRTGQRSDIDPAAWEIVGGRLFLMRSRAERSAWMQDLAGNAGRADGAWRRIEIGSADGR